MTGKRIDRRGRSMRDLAESTGLSRATIARHTSLTRDEWLQQKAAEREEIRAFHDDQEHSWPETADHFGLSEDTVKRRAYRARKERAQEEDERAQPPLPLAQ
jgi:DNA-binding Lrp family transcriptional regulator